MSYIESLAICTHIDVKAEYKRFKDIVHLFDTPDYNKDHAGMKYFPGDKIPKSFMGDEIKLTFRLVFYKDDCMNEFKHSDKLPLNDLMHYSRVTNKLEICFAWRINIKLTITHNRRIHKFPAISHLIIKDTYTHPLPPFPKTLKKFDFADSPYNIKLPPLNEGLREFYMGGEYDHHIESVPDSLVIFDAGCCYDHPYPSFPDTLEELHTGGITDEMPEPLPSKLRCLSIHEGDHYPMDLGQLSKLKNLRVLWLGYSFDYYGDLGKVLPDGLETLDIVGSRITWLTSFPDSIRALRILERQVFTIERLPSSLVTAHILTELSEKCVLPDGLKSLILRNSHYIPSLPYSLNYFKTDLNADHNEWLPEELIEKMMRGRFKLEVFHDVFKDRSQPS